MFQLTYFFTVLSLWPWPFWKRLLSGAFLFHKHTLLDRYFDNYNWNIGRYFWLIIDLLFCLTFGFLFVCCLGIIVPFENFSLIWRCHHYLWKAGKVELCSTLMAIEQWGFSKVPHLLWHGVSAIICLKYWSYSLKHYLIN